MFQLGHEVLNGLNLMSDEISFIVTSSSTVATVAY